MFRQAAQRLDAASALSPRHLDVLDRQATLFERQGDGPSAARVLLSMVELAAPQQHDRALALLQRVLSIDPTNPSVHTLARSLGLAAQLSFSGPKVPLARASSASSPRIMRPPSMSVSRPKTKDEIVLDLLGQPDWVQAALADARANDNSADLRDHADEGFDLSDDISFINLELPDDISQIQEIFPLDDPFSTPTPTDAKTPVAPPPAHKSAADHLWEAETADVSQTLSDGADFFASLQSDAQDDDSDLEDALEDVELFLSQRKLPHARALLDDLRAQFKDHPAILACYRRLHLLSQT
jgi:hypothetical protein